MLSHGLQETSGNPKGSLSGRRNGRNAMDYCVSETASMFQMIRSYAAALHRNTMTPRLQATPDAGKPWSLSPRATGGHRCPDTLVSILGHATSVSGQRFNGVAQLENSIRSPLRRAAGMSSAWTLLVNFRTLERWEAKREAPNEQRGERPQGHCIARRDEQDDALLTTNQNIYTRKGPRGTSGTAGRPEATTPSSPPQMVTSASPIAKPSTESPTET